MAAKKSLAESVPLEEAVVRRSPIPPQSCLLAKSFDLIGDRWSLLILRSAMYGVTRFEDFRAELEIPRTILSRRLTQLVERGLMDKREYRAPGQRARFEYPLTDMGASMRVPFLALWQWSAKWIDPGRSPQIAFKSLESDERISVALVDTSGRIVDPTKLKAEVLKPGAKS